MTQTVLDSSAFADALEKYYIEASDDIRKVIVGLQEQSQQAEIYARFAHLYTTDQLELLAAERAAATDPELREGLNRLWFGAAEAVAARDVIQAAQDLTNDRLAYRATWDGEEVSINTIGALIAAETDFDRREQLFTLSCQADEHFAARDLKLTLQAIEIRSEVFGLDGEIAIAQAAKGIDITDFSRQVNATADATAERYAQQSANLVPSILGRDIATPSRAHAAYMRSLHQFDDIYTRERMAEVCQRTVAELGFPLDEIPTILPDLEDRPQKSPRACVIATRVPDEVHLVVRPTGGITDYQAFLHEAGHALHFGLTDASLPFTFRYTSPDNALTEIYSYIVERITHSPLWHERHFGLDHETAEKVCAHIRYVDSSLYRRYAAKLSYELEFWLDPADPRNPDRYAMLLSNATRMRYPTSSYLSDMDPGFYAADYLRAWRSSEQMIVWLKSEYGEDWFCNGKAAGFLRDLFRRGTRPTNEDILEIIGSTADDFSAVTAHLMR